MTRDADEAPVLLSIDAPIAHITLNRPGKLNALDLACLDLLEQHIATAEADERARVVVISGRGRCFCAGADLSVVDDAIASNAFGAFLEHWHAAFQRIEACTKPTIAAAHGMALAGGFELTQVCDLVVIGDATRIGDQHAKFGLFPGGGSTQRLPRMVGRRTAAWMLLSGESIPPAHAVALGLANEVAPEADVLTRAAELAHVLAERSVSASHAIKEAMRRGRDLDLPAALDLEIGLAVAHMSSADAATGLAAFKARTTPDFGYRPPVRVTPHRHRADLADRSRRRTAERDFRGVGSVKPRIPPADVPDPDTQATLDKGYRYNGAPLNAARTLARHPRLLKRFTLYAGLFLSESLLPDRDRELVTLRCAHRFDSDYYFGHHARLASGLLSADEVARAVGPAEAWDGWDLVLISAVDELADDEDLSDATWEVLAARYDDAQLLDLVMLVGFYRMTCLYVNTIGIERESGITGWPAERIQP